VSRPSPYDAIVLAGGAGRRLGGLDKAALEIGRATLLDYALAACAGAHRRIVVGPARALPTGVLLTSEDPPGGGPVAGVQAGLALVREPVVVLLACDMPALTAPTVARLADTAAAAETADGAVLVDEDGRRQHLASAFRTERLRHAVALLGQPRGASMRNLLNPLTVVEVRADPEQTSDCDTWDDVTRFRDRLEGR